MVVTIKEVAEIAGVSTATVSRVMNGTKPVSEEVRNRVMQAIEKTGFKPNSVARSLILKKSYMLGVIISDIGDRYFGELVRGIETTANFYGYNIILCSSNYEEKKEMEYLNLLENKQVDGIIFATRSLKQNHINFFNRTKIPIVSVNRRFQGIPSVRVDNFNESYKAVKYLIGLGHKNIGFICGNLEDETSGKERFEGYKKGLEENDIPFRPTFICEGDFTIRGGYNAMEKLLFFNKELTAVFAANDEMAFGAMNLVFDKGKKVPDDISVIGFDDIEFSRYMRPQLTTVHQPIYSIGEEAAKAILKLINNEELEKYDLVLNGNLIVRESTKMID